MFGTTITLPLLTTAAGAAFGVMISGQGAWMIGAGIGFGAGCGVLGVIWLFFAILEKLAE